MAMSRATAIGRVSMLCDANSYPQLSTTEIGTILDDLIRWNYWTASTAYIVDDLIVPTIPNGRMYRCIAPGTSDASTPTFPVFPSVGFINQTIYESTTSGVIWIDIGTAQKEQFDVQGATRRAWLLKASKCVGDVDAKESMSDVKLSQLVDHCTKMAERFRPLVIA